jgi:hypothetical protein
LKQRPDFRLVPPDNDQPKGDAPMKVVLLAGLAIAAMFTMAAPAAAYEGPWCVQFNLGRSSADRCEFATFEACAQERILQGTTAFCHQNPRYLPYWQGRGFGVEPAAPFVHKKRHRHRHG